MSTSAQWLARYYPTPAAEVAEDDAILHSLRKWRGLRAEVLAVHGITTSGRRLYDACTGARVLPLEATSCALCVHYMETEDEDGHPERLCTRCPLTFVRGTPCDDAVDEQPPWFAWTEDNDPEPMIALLEDAAWWDMVARPWYAEVG